MLSTPHALVATLLVMLLYVAAGLSVKNRWNHKFPLNPLKIVADLSGRASLSNTQVFYFTIIVVWLAVYWVVQGGELVPFDDSILYLLGIAVVGSGVGKATDIARFRVTGVNWAWAKKKGWIKRDFTGASAERVPRLSDLIATEQGFDVARFQAVAFSLVVGIALLYNGATATDAKSFSTFTIGGTYLSLVGLSQTVYVGGKLVSGNLVADLNVALDRIRQLEAGFSLMVAKSDAWRNAAATERTIDLAREHCAVDEYAAYMSAASDAIEMVESLTGVSVDSGAVQPALPH